MDSGLQSGPGGCLRVSSAVGADRTLVVVEGEADFTTSPRLAEALEEAMANRVGRVDVDLGSLSFCDCSCVHVLLAARERAMGAGLMFACVALSPCAERVLELTQAGPLLQAA
ncbi:STAS domain-containing protein [Streptomyces sp. NPDC048384]|jgi:anti-anti-sigma factor|uniref:STAS domain-containing protein n=1 Tax=Streptomyces sp. NPDC048384 TaxID=3155487 RepID=UPI003436D653